MREYTFYTVQSYWWYDPGYNQICFWRETGSGPGGNSIEEAYTRVKKDIERYIENGVDLTKVKFRITKTVKIDTIEDELLNEDFTALILKTA